MPDVRVSTLVKLAYGLMVLALLASGVVDIVAATGRAPNRVDITDFHTFFIVGRLILSGQVVDAYHAGPLMRLEEAMGGRPVFMPWSYPPPFGLIVAGLALLPLAAAYLSFAIGTLVFCLWATGRLAGEERWPVMLASVVSVVLNLRCGQNGLLTAGIVAAGAAALLHRAPLRCGGWLGAMVIKPHIVLVLPVWLAFQRRWVVLAGMASVGLALSTASIVILGPEVLAALLHSLTSAERLLSMGAYPLYRMTSVFAFLLSIGVPPRLALLLHGVVALGALGMVMVVTTRGGDLRLNLGLAVMAGLFVSPYVYDYDQPVFGVGLILAAPALQRRMSGVQYRGLLILWAAAQSPGFLFNLIANRSDAPTVALMGPLVLSTFGLVVYSALKHEVSATRAPPPIGGIDARRDLVTE